ncbi:MAG: helix-turn-helix domain-containing protein [Ardenticatenaceae bacterium]
MTQEDTTIQAEMWLRDVKTIKVFAHTLRLEIVRLMEEPTTVKSVAAELAIPASKLYYHVNLLHQHGLIRVVEQKIEGNLVEKVYQVAARQFKLVNPLLSDSVSDESATALFTSMLQATQRDFSQAYAAREKSESTPPRAPFLSKKAFRLTDEQLTALHAKLDALIREVTELGTTNRELEADTYDLTVVFYKQPPKGELS